jgi:hypothetical protein
LIGLFVLNRLGFVYIASSFAVVLTGVGSFFLIDENLRATFVTMPILIASSLLVPWAEFVVVLIDAAAILGIDLSLLILLIVTIISHQFADSLERAYRAEPLPGSHDPLPDLSECSLFLDRLEQALGCAERDGRVVGSLWIWTTSRSQTLKVDKSYLSDGLGEDTVNDTTVRLIVNFAYMLGLKVTAEGVENER